MSVKTLISTLDYSFQDLSLLQQALRHRSAGHPSYERLEFLGDAILDFIVGEELFHQYQEKPEGELSRLRANLVNGKILAKVAADLKIGNFIELGLGEKKTGGAQRDSILSDVVEAIIGAIYLDSDFATCKKCVLTWLRPYLNMVDTIEQKDAKSNLQEFVQGRKLPLPQYKIIKTEGAAHQQTFHVSCQVQGLPFHTLGVASSRREAEQEAAAKFLLELEKGKE